MKIAIFGKSFQESFTIYMNDLVNKLLDNNIEILIFKQFYDFLNEQGVNVKEKVVVFNQPFTLSDHIDFVLSIGGDGTFLETVYYVRNNNIPILGINAGRLGYLANTSENEISEAIDLLLQNKYSIEERTLIQIDDKKNIFGDFSSALNEISIHRNDSSSLLTIHTYINNEFLNTYWADGLIIATPTGSTAYSLSAGGPIIVPNSENFVITPIAPHNLTVRPIVISDKNEIILKVESRSPRYLVTADYRSVTFDTGIELKIKKADYKVKLVKFKNQSYFNTLRNKLMWGADKRN